MKCLLATGWYADSKGHNNPTRSKQFLAPDYLTAIWIPYIERFIKPEHYFFYISNCEILPEGFFKTEVPFEFIYGHNDAGKQNHRYDGTASHMIAAQYALCNGLDLVYIEQDCLVYGLDKALEWADGKKICYGFGDNASYAPGWTEHSFEYVSNEYLPDFIRKLNGLRVHEKIELGYMERVWHTLFEKDASYWPFGHGRKRPIDFTQDAFYSQQMNDIELEEFMKKGDAYDG